MTVSDTEFSCPLCDSTDTEKINQDKLRCSDCNLIIAADTPSTEFEIAAESLSQDRDVVETRQWQDTVTVRDSSDEMLVSLIGDTEDRIRELDGTTEDCVKAAETVAEAWEQQYFRGRSISTGIAAVVYASFRKQESPRPLGIVAETCGVSDQEIRTAYRSLKSDYDMHNKITPVDTYIPYLRTRLGLDEVTEQRAREILETSIGVTGSPTSIASACLYLATEGQDKSITLAEAGAVSGVAKETVWKKTQDLKA